MMLGIGMQEILIILVVALIVIGPKRLPELAKTLGKGFAEFRKAADDLQETVRLDLQKERHEEFRQKYPDMVPDEDEDDLMQKVDDTPGGEAGGPYRASDTNANGDTLTDKSASETVPESSSAKATEDRPSYNPDEIEGGDFTEDDNKDV